MFTTFPRNWLPLVHKQLTLTTCMVRGAQGRPSDCNSRALLSLYPRFIRRFLRRVLYYCWWLTPYDDCILRIDMCVRCTWKNSSEATYSSRRKSCWARSRNGRFGIALGQLLGSQVSTLLCSLSVSRGSIHLDARTPSETCNVAAGLKDGMFYK